MSARRCSSQFVHKGRTYRCQFGTGHDGCYHTYWTGPFRATWTDAALGGTVDPR